MNQNTLDDKALVARYIFDYPADNPERQEEIEKELQRRGLLKRAKQIFAELHDVFDKKWYEKEDIGE